MIFDYQNLLSNDQAITASAASTNAIDLGAEGADTPTPNMNAGFAGHIMAIVTKAFTNLTSLTVALQCDSDEEFGSATTLDSVTVALADLVAGKTLKFRIDEGCERYVRLYYTVTGSAPDAGTILAGFTLDDQVNR